MARTAGRRNSRPQTKAAPAAAPIHPAILALRAVVAAFTAAQEAAGNTVSSLLMSDLTRHDEPAIGGQPLSPFGWIIGLTGTHLCFIGDTGPTTDRYITRIWKSWPAMVADAYADTPLEFYFWDGVALQACAGARVLHTQMNRARASIALAAHEARLTQLRKEYAHTGECENFYRSLLDKQIAEAKREIERLTAIQNDLDV